VRTQLCSHKRFKVNHVPLARIRHTAKQNNSQALTLTLLDPFRDQMYTNTVKSDHKLITTPETHTATQEQEKHYQRQKTKNDFDSQEPNPRAVWI
jgi:hypothetical protein